MEAKKVNSAQLAREIGVSHVTIGNFLNGQLPKSEHLWAVARFFGVRMDDLFGPKKELFRDQIFSRHLPQPANQSPFAESALQASIPSIANAEVAKELEKIERRLEDAPTCSIQELSKELNAIRLEISAIRRSLRGQTKADAAEGSDRIEPAPEAPNAIFEPVNPGIPG